MFHDDRILLSYSISSLASQTYFSACTHARMRSGRGKGEEKYVWALSTGFRAPARNVGMTNQIAATHKLHSTKSTIGFQEAWRMASFSESEVASALSRAATKLGYSTLLPQQERVVRAFVRGRDVFVSLPTGSGKSLCYCLLPLLFDELYGSQRKSIVVVVCPLIEQLIHFPGHCSISAYSSFVAYFYG